MEDRHSQSFEYEKARQLSQETAQPRAEVTAAESWNREASGYAREIEVTLSAARQALRFNSYDVDQHDFLVNSGGIPKTESGSTIRQLTEPEKLNLLAAVPEDLLDKLDEIFELTQDLEFLFVRYDGEPEKHFDSASYARLVGYQKELQEVYKELQAVGQHNAPKLLARKLDSYEAQVGDHVSDSAVRQLLGMKLSIDRMQRRGLLVDKNNEQLDRYRKFMELQALQRISAILKSLEEGLFSSPLTTETQSRMEKFLDYLSSEIKKYQEAGVPLPGSVLEQLNNLRKRASGLNSQVKAKAA